MGADPDSPAWDVAAKAFDEELRPAAASIRSVACANDVIVTGSSQPVVKVWQIAEGALTVTHRLSLVDAHGAVGSSCVEVSGSVEGQIAAICYDDGGIGLWDLRTGQSAGELPAGIQNAWKAKFLPDQRRLASAGTSGSVCFWDLRMAKLESEVSARLPRSKEADDAKRRKMEADSAKAGNPVYSLCVSPDGALLGCGRASGAISVMRLEHQEFTSDVVAHTGDGTVAVRACSFDSQSRLILSGGDDQHVALFDAAVWARRKEIRRHSQLEKFSAHRSWVTSVSACPDPHQRVAVTTSWDGTVKLWDYTTHRLLNTYKDHTDSVFDSAFAPLDGKFFVTVGVDAQLVMYTAKHPVTAANVELHPSMAAQIPKSEDPSGQVPEEVAGF